MHIYIYFLHVWFSLLLYSNENNLTAKIILDLWYQIKTIIVMLVLSSYGLVTVHLSCKYLPHTYALFSSKTAGVLLHCLVAFHP